MLDSLMVFTEMGQVSGGWENVKTRVTGMGVHPSARVTTTRSRYGELKYFVLQKLDEYQVYPWHANMFSGFTTRGVNLPLSEDTISQYTTYNTIHKQYSWWLDTLQFTPESDMVQFSMDMIRFRSFPVRLLSVYWFVVGLTGCILSKVWYYANSLYYKACFTKMLPNLYCLSWFQWCISKLLSLSLGYFLPFNSRNYLGW